MIVHLRPLPRAAYTLLELMIALGLLGMLLSVAWSLMGTYRDAEQRGWKVARRTQVIRAARSWLESDMQHVLLSDSPSQVAAARSGGSPAASGLSGVLPTAPPGAASANWRFVGNAQGFSATIAPSLDPLPFLERLMTDSLGASSAPGSLAAGSSAAGSSAAGPLAASQGATDLPADLPGAGPPQASPWPADTVQVEYRLTPTAAPASASIQTASNQAANSQAANAPAAQQTIRDAAMSEIQYMLTRRELLSPAQLPQGDLSASSVLADVSAASERLLTAQDLYRQNEDQPLSQGVVVQESRLEGLCQAQFRYCDGRAWKNEWNSTSDGGLPAAIALSFDFPARADMRRPEPRRVSPEDPLGESSDPAAEMELSFADSALAAEAVEEGTADGERSLLQFATQQVQIVVRLESRFQPGSLAAVGASRTSGGVVGGDF